MLEKNCQEDKRIVKYFWQKKKTNKILKRMIIIKSNSFSHGRKKGPAHRRQTKKKKKKKKKQEKEKKTKKEMEKQKQKILHLERRVEAIALSQVMLWAYLLVGASATRTVLFASSLDDENERGILRELIPKHFRRVASSRRLLSNSRILFFSPSFFLPFSIVSI